MYPGARLTPLCRFQDFLKHLPHYRDPRRVSDNWQTSPLLLHYFWLRHVTEKELKSLSYSLSFPFMYLHMINE